MSHTTITKNMRFHYNGGYDGLVHMVFGEEEIEVPFEDLKEFIAGYVRTKQIEKIGDLSDDELLGIWIGKTS